MTTPPQVTLTDGEYTTLDGLAQGWTSPTHIAREHGLDPADIRRHIASLMTKLGVYDLGPLVTAAVELRLIPALSTPNQRELQALVGLANGDTHQRIARSMRIALRELRIHVGALYAKLGAANAAHAVDLAHRAGLLPAAVADIPEMVTRLGDRYLVATGQPPLKPSVRLLQAGASYALHRAEIRPAHLGRAVDVDLLSARVLADRLALWQIVTPRTGAAGRRSIILPKHERFVLRLIATHEGYVPEPNPLRELRVPGLTAQFRMVLDLVAAGMNNIEIGAALRRSDETIKTQVGQLCRHLGARNRTHLVTIAHAWELLPNPYLDVSRKDSP